MPQIFDAGEKWNILRADKIGDEMHVQYIIRSGGDEYQRINEIKAGGARPIVPVGFPMAYYMTDPQTARLISLTELKFWEMAPGNPAALVAAGIPFALTSNGLSDRSNFLKNIRKAIAAGLSNTDALKALTETPAQLIHTEQMLGSLKSGYMANFFICAKPIFDDDAIIYENWVQGEGFMVKEMQKGNTCRFLFSSLVRIRLFSFKWKCLGHAHQ